MQIHVGDCREVMAQMDACSVDAVVTDPPYELGFMGKAWDATAVTYDVETWRAALRVLKPGGHLVAFGAPRTYHRLACAIEDAGFEIRDSLMWLFGSGFPKSLDVSKAIDKAAPRAAMFAPFAQHFRECLTRSGKSQREVATLFPSRTGGLTGCVSNWALGYGVPTLAQWRILAPLLGLSDEWMPLVERVEAEREVIGRSANQVGVGWAEQGLAGYKPEFDVTAPATPDAERWQGWGTALKPAYEPIVLARKPLIGTVAANVLAYGTGGINVDGCRIESDGEHKRLYQPTNNGRAVYGAQTGFQPSNAEGRWPANVCMDEAAAALLDAEASERGGGFGIRGGSADGHGIYNGAFPRGDLRTVGYGDSGGPSRFFYTSKSSRAEREAGLEDFDATRRSDGRAKDIENPRLRTNARRNDHPTVKPVDLMRWLCRLITPPGGLILDPFMGSGGTGIAAELEGFQFVGIELDPHYAEIAEARIAAVPAPHPQIGMVFE